MADTNYLQGDPNSFQWGQGQWQGTGGGETAQKYYAWKKFAQLFGRNPTQGELDQLYGAYGAGDANKTNVGQGDSVIAQYYNQQTNTPEKQYADQQAAYLKDAPKFYDQINQQFQSSVGRDATQEEKDHFGSLLASGQVDSYGVGQWLSQLPEAVTKQDQAFRTGLSSDLQKQDAQYYNEQVLPGIQSQFANQGRDINSSGFANSLALAAQGQNRQREGFLSNLTAAQYGGNKQNAYDQYLNSVGRYQGMQDYSRQRTDMLSDQTRNRTYDIQNFNMQKQAYDDYLSRYGKRSSGAGIGALAGGLLGAGLGIGLAGPGGGAAGGQLGYSIGSGTGGGIGSFF